MSTDIIRKNFDQSLTLSSLDDLVKAATDFPMLLIDCSGSMDTAMRNGKTRIEALREVVAQIKADHGGVTMIAFGGEETSSPRFVDGVPNAGGGTPLHLAIPYAKSYGATRVVVISDGLPDMRQESLHQARLFGGPIDVYYVGDPGDQGSFFLEELAAVTGGKRFEGDLGNPKQLAAGVAGLLMGAVEERAPIQGEGFAVVETEPEEEDDDDDTDDDDDEDDDEDGK